MQNLGVKTYARKVQERREQEAQMGECDDRSASNGQKSFHNQSDDDNILDEENTPSAKKSKKKPQRIAYETTN
jgi:hypothetical protein